MINKEILTQEEIKGIILTEVEGTSVISTRLRITVPDNLTSIQFCIEHEYSLKIICDAILSIQKNLDWGQYIIDENIEHKNGEYIFHVLLLD